MDVSDLRQRILRALEAGKPDAPARPRVQVDEAHEAYEKFLAIVAVPMLKQAQGILKAEAHAFSVHTPAGGARLVSDAYPKTFLEFALDVAGTPRVLGRVSIGRGSRVNVEEQPIASGKTIGDLNDDDVAAFFVTEIPKLVGR
jgi:hypothetical protein